MYVVHCPLTVPNVLVHVLLLSPSLTIKLQRWDQLSRPRSERSTRKECPWVCVLCVVCVCVCTVLLCVMWLFGIIGIMIRHCYIIPVPVGFCRVCHYYYTPTLHTYVRLLSPPPSPHTHTHTHTHTHALQVIVEKVAGARIADLDRKKYLVPGDLTGTVRTVSHCVIDCYW